jgi:hypothetical protein
MDSVKKLTKSIHRMSGEKGQLYAAYGIFAAAILYIFYNGQLATIGLALGVALVLYAVTKHNLIVSLVGGALAGLVAVHYSRSRREGFASKPVDSSENDSEDMEPKNEAEEKKEGFKQHRKGSAPNNGERAEFFELGKKYKGPSEEDDSEFHLDAGTTFMNAYKALKPDQIASMTKDTQELMQTQRQLMSTLSTLKPLIQDGKQMMDMFQSYFGSGTASMN